MTRPPEYAPYTAERASSACARTTTDGYHAQPAVITGLYLLVGCTSGLAIDNGHDFVLGSLVQNAFCDDVLTKDPRNYHFPCFQNGFLRHREALLHLRNDQYNILLDCTFLEVPCSHIRVGLAPRERALECAGCPRTIPLGLLSTTTKQSHAY